MSVPIRVKLLRDGARTPQYQTQHAAGADLHACLDQPITLRPGERAAVPTGLAIELPPGYEAQVRARSGLALKSGIGMANGAGTIDADYRGELMAIVINHGQEDFVINHGDRIAQMVVAKHEVARFEEAQSLSETSRGEGGYGSTGV